MEEVKTFLRNHNYNNLPDEILTKEEEEDLI